MKIEPQRRASLGWDVSLVALAFAHFAARLPTCANLKALNTERIEDGDALADAVGGGALVDLNVSQSDLYFPSTPKTDGRPPRRRPAGARGVRRRLC